MQRIFVSHSSADAAIARALLEKLESWGYATVFLDFDFTRGIVVGEPWVERLFTELRSCSVLIFLSSRSSVTSRWCFAELAGARLLGRGVLPVEIEPVGDDAGLLGSVQACHLYPDAAEGYERLRRALAELGMDPDRSFLPTPGRDPFPGFQSFEDGDEAFYFGREGDIAEISAKLNQLHDFGPRRIVAVTGSSGVGKSSLMKAGVIPFLRKSARRWLAPSSFRPGGELAGAFTNAVSQIIAGEIADAGVRLSTSDLTAAIRARDLDATHGYLTRLAADVRQVHGYENATLVISIDQFEEVLWASTPSQTLFLVELIQAICTGTSQIQVLMTVRYDGLSRLCEEYPAVAALIDLCPIKPLTPSGLTAVIEEPARVMGIRIAPGLARRIVDDCGRGDALPLMGLTLRQMYERDRRHFSSAGYETLGGIQGVLKQVADAALSGRPGGTLTAKEELQLRNAFLQLVDLDPSENFVRRQTVWDAIPNEARGAIERLVALRLVSHGENGSLEVAHEALFRVWDKLRGWLELDRELLRWRREVQTARSAWEGQGRREEFTVGDAVAAGLGRSLRETHLSPSDRQYLDECRRKLKQSARDKILTSLGRVVASFTVFLVAMLVSWYVDRKLIDIRGPVENANTLSLLPSTVVVLLFAGWLLIGQMSWRTRAESFALASAVVLSVVFLALATDSRYSNNLSPLGNFGEVPLVAAALLSAVALWLGLGGRSDEKWRMAALLLIPLIAARFGRNGIGENPLPDLHTLADSLNQNLMLPHASVRDFEARGFWYTPLVTFFILPFVVGVSRPAAPASRRKAMVIGMALLGGAATLCASALAMKHADDVVWRLDGGREALAGLVTLQEQFRKRKGTYAASADEIAEMCDPLSFTQRGDFKISQPCADWDPGFGLRIVTGSRDGWSAVAGGSDAASPACAVFGGRVTEVPLTTGGRRPSAEGQPVCDEP